MTFFHGWVYPPYTAKFFKQGQNKNNYSERMKGNLILAGEIIFVIVMGIFAIYEVEGFKIVPYHQIISVLFVFLVLVDVAMLLRRYFKKSETKQNPS